LLRNCLNSLLAQTWPLDEIFVIDNASTDGTEEVVKKEFPNLSYIRMLENVGGAGGFYEGIKRAYDKGYDWIWLFDDDAVARRDALEKIVNKLSGLEKMKIGVLMSRTASEPERKDVSKEWKVLEKRDPLIFVGALLNRKVIDEIGLPRKDFFIYCDDMEYFERMKKAKFIQIKVLDSIIEHFDWTANYILKRLFFLLLRKPTYPPWKGYYLVRNNIILAKLSKNVVKLVFEIAKAIIKSFLFMDNDRAKFMLRGLVDGLRMRTGKIEIPE
jgi:GT2 family glycosyltransferase